MNDEMMNEMMNVKMLDEMRMMRWLNCYGYVCARSGGDDLGRMRLAEMRERLNMPLLVINDSPIKQFAENRHAVGQSVLEAFIRMTNRATNGRRMMRFRLRRVRERASR